MATGVVGPQGRVDIVLDMTTATVAASETFSIRVTRAFRVVGVTVLCEATIANGAVEVFKGASTVTGGTVPCAVLNAVSNGGIVTSAATFAVGDTLNITVTAPAGGVQGIVIVRTVPLPLANQSTITGA